MDGERVIKGVLAFMAFGFAASAVYILNDLLDLESDRRHPQKRSRPLAAGLVPIPLAFATVPVALALSLMVAATLLPALLVGILVLYLGTTTAYSFALKRIAILDVLVLAGLYTLRVLAGAVATDVHVSPWFLAFSTFFFLSLAFVKRYAELRLAAGEWAVQDYLLARGYIVGDADLLRSLGATSGYLAIAVLALYMNSPEVLVLYSRPAALWLIGPLLLYWVTRIWFLAHRGRMECDPVVFALTDCPSYVLTALVATLLIIAALT
jgi:4-hydroxybenzoate polyprenyltransferase